MILLDANILIYAYTSNLPEHVLIHRYLEQQLSGPSRVGLPWQSTLAFVRIVTNRRIFEHPARMEDAWQQVEAWLDVDNVWVPTPTERHRSALSTMLPHAAARSNLVPDAELAALALEHGLAIVSTDGDFTRFPGVRVVNPLLPV
ncbi:MAG: TA system VapC family ribonuclease toxin [Acidimicrobiales bacterium]